MAISDKDVTRFLAGELPHDDPAWAEVSALLQRLDSVYPTTSTAALEASHLAAVVAAVGNVRSDGPSRSTSTTEPAKTPGLVVAGLATALVGLTAGVGMASAMGIGALDMNQDAPAELSALARQLGDPSSPAPAPTPEPTASQTADEADDDSVEYSAPRAAAPKSEKTKTKPKVTKTKPKAEPKPKTHHEDSDDEDDEDESDHHEDSDHEDSEDD